MAQTTTVQTTYVKVGHVVPQPSWHMDSHRHGVNNEMVLVVRGALRVHIGGGELEACQGQVLLYPAGWWHEEWAVGSEPLETLFISFQTRPLRVMADWPLLCRDRQGRFEYLLRWMLEPAARASQTVDVLCRLAVSEYRQCLQAPQQADLASKTRQYIREHLAGPISLEHLAGNAALTRFHFSRLLRRSVGLAPMQLVRQMRVEAAQALLLRTDLPLKVIAREVGFATVYHFCRVFTRVAGTSPAAMRRRYAGQG